MQFYSLDVDGISGNLFVGFTPGNFLQLAFPTDAERFPSQKGSEASHFAFALYITSTSGNKGRVGEELPTEQKDTGPTYVTSITVASLSSLVKTRWRKPSNSHRLLWNIVFTCLSRPLGGSFLSSWPSPSTASPTLLAGLSSTLRLNRGTFGPRTLFSLSATS